MAIFDFLKILKSLLAPFAFVGRKVAIVINYLLLTLVYFTALAGTALIAKLLRKKMLERQIEKAKPSYWIDRKKEDYTKKEAYRAF